MGSLKKAAALILTGLTVVSSAQAALVASALSVEEAVQAAIAIANDDSHGYSQTDRWGPNYDCSSFVITALRNAGFDTGDAYGTVNLKHELCKHGFKWYPWSEIKDMSNLKRGDILLNESMHTEFYIGRGQDVGAHHDHGNPQSGDQNGQEISISGYYNNPWDGVLRYTNDIPKVKPSDLEISTYGDSCAVGNTMHFEFFSINSASQKLSVFRNGSKVSDIDVSNKFSYDLQVKEAGHYTYRFSASNIVGTSEAPEGEFTAYADAPKILDFSVDKSKIALGDTVKLSFRATEAKSQTLYISSSDMYDSVNVTDMTEYEFKPQQGGVYYFRFIAYNPVGSNSADSLLVNVFDKAPEITSVWTNNSVSAIGIPIQFGFGTNDAMKQELIIEHDGAVVEYVDVTNTDSFIRAFADPGKYTYRLEASNPIGTSKRDGEPFTVYADAPANLKIKTDKKEYNAGDEVVFELGGDNYTTATVIYNADNGWNTGYVYKNDDGQYKTTISGDGEYECYFKANNDLGEVRSDVYKFNVYGKKPENGYASADNYKYTVGQTATFSIYSHARKTVLEILSDSKKIKEADVSGKSEYPLLLDSAGEFTYRITSSNGGEEYTSSEYSYIVDEGYTVSFDTGYYYYGENFPDMTKKYSEDLMLPSAVPKMEGCRFLGWSTQYNAAAPQYFASDTYSINQSTTLYAVWQPIDSAVNARYKISEWIWDDYGNARAVFKGQAAVKKESDDVPEPEDIVLYAAVDTQQTDAACDSDGEITYTAQIDFQGSTYSDVHTNVITAGGHNYTPVKWKWDGIRSAEVTLVCEFDPTHTVTLPAEVEVEEHTDEWSSSVYANYKVTLGEQEFTYQERYYASKLGDMDFDSTVTSADALEILRISAGGAAESETAYMMSDADGDRAITSADALEVLRFSAGSSDNKYIGKLSPTRSYYSYW
ncbi:MAG: InlB B-repeat-containing protein [Clostridia bacterium]|nr:InlB B-repeat-containing protein [Clostridia bacterium]